jgi:hypothetical protein
MSGGWERVREWSCAGVCSDCVVDADAFSVCMDHGRGLYRAFCVFGL